MVQTIIVFILFAGIVAYHGFKFFRKDKSTSSKGCSCSGCDSAKKVAS